MTNKPADAELPPGCAAAIIIAALVFFIIIAANRTPEPPPSPEQRAMDRDSNAAAALIPKAKQAVLDRLRSPGSADFPWGDYEYGRDSDGRLFIRSYVDAQNGFGALLRSNWKVVFDRGQVVDVQITTR